VAAVRRQERIITLRDITLITEDGREVRLADTAEVTLGHLSDAPATTAQVESLGINGFSVGFTLPPSAWAWANYVAKSIMDAAGVANEARAAAEGEEERGND
jgi:hypothetical protein